jgi:hypothetical protein
VPSQKSIYVCLGRGVGVHLDSPQDPYAFPSAQPHTHSYKRVRYPFSNLAANLESLREKGDG